MKEREGRMREKKREKERKKEGRGEGRGRRDEERRGWDRKKEKANTCAQELCFY